MFTLLATAAAIAAALPAQQIRVAAPVAVAAPQGPGAASPDDDPGISVDMFENANIDRYLRGAQKFLEREDYSGAINLLQQVIEGRFTVVADTGPEEGADPKEAKDPKDEGAAKKGDEPEDKAEKKKQQVQLLEDALARRRGDAAPVKKVDPPDARNARYSSDGRLFRPVRRQCHELLARMPAVGLEIYRANYEVAAEELLQEALRDGSIHSLEQVANRYFATLPAGKAMTLLADRLMHEGRHRAAVLVLSDLLTVYPADLRKRLGVQDVWCRFKMALCLQLAGEQSGALDAVQALAAAFPEDSLRVLGELHAVKDLPSDALFARDVAVVPSAAPIAHGWLADEAVPLVPLWQFRFRNPDPYKDPKASGDRNQIFFDGVTTATMPYAGRYGPATWVAFTRNAADPAAPPQANFLEHFCLRTVDATTGVLTTNGDGNEEPPVAREGQPRVRVAANDFALLRPIDGQQHRYVVLGHPRGSTASVEALKANTLVAYGANDGKRAWDSGAWLEGDSGLRDVMFLAAPTVFGGKLLLPAMRQGRFTLECLDRETGRPLWHTILHGGGTPFFKAPGCPVVVQSGVAFVATNSGCVAAIDAFTGDLRWIRRYERIDPARKPTRVKKPASNDNMWGRPQFGNEELTGFLPNDMLAFDGLVVVAPIDGDMLLCLDGATGQPQWMLDGATTRYVPYGKLRSVVGRAGDDLFVLTDTHLVGIGASGGLLKWSRELPPWNGPKNTGRGRGAVAGDCIVLPGERELLVFALDGKPLRRVPMPAFGESKEPLAGSANIVVDGAWLAVGYQGGVEVFSARPALQALAATTADPLRRADLLVRAGDSPAAEAALVVALRAATDEAARQRLGTTLLALTRDRASTLAKQGDASAALALLDGIVDLLVDRKLWHLARVEICKDHGDLAAHEREQNRLYDYMEGKG
ncbi:MAG: PQQ-binding-like beta-propeller repeat protein [Planctomycetes bacterium]|nr:PQQ-binding-like beta-propeller repeat protein [Planctomycetota bacterium]